MYMQNILYLLLILTISCTSINNKKTELENKAYPNKEWAHTNVNYSKKTKRIIDSLGKVFEKFFHCSS